MIISICLLGLTFALDEPVIADRVIRGGLIVDGTGSPGKVGDLALQGDRIVAVGQFKVAGKPQVMDASGMVVAPGFIDLHTHSDSTLVLNPTNANLCYLLQGVTTVVTGNCGSGPIRVAEYYRKLERIHQGSNVIHLVPHNDLRQTVMGNSNRKPSTEELSQMVALTNQGMKDGAWGLSTGLVYTPGVYSQTDELITLAKTVTKSQGIYASHIRGEGVEAIEAIGEALTIAKESGIAVHISHLKASGKRSWGMADQLITLIEKARKQGLTVTADQYPYTASSSPLDALVIPPRFREGDRQAFLQRLYDPDQRSKIRQAVETILAEMEGGKAIRIAYCRPKPSWVGKDLVSLANQENKKVADVVLEIERTGGAQVIYFAMREEDVQLIMKQDWVATASDGGSRMPDPDSLPHPRSFGCFARKVGRLAIEEELIPLEKAIRSCSGLPADILGLQNRGYLKADMVADVIIFDPKTYRDVATYSHPQRYAVGIKSVFVNGKLAIDQGKSNGLLAGRALRRGQD